MYGSYDTTLYAICATHLTETCWKHLRSSESVPSIKNFARGIGQISCELFQIFNLAMALK